MTPESAHWFTSSYSGPNGACVEVATNLAHSHGIVPLRDSKALAGTTLTLPTAAYAHFIRNVTGV